MVETVVRHTTRCRSRLCRATTPQDCAVGQVARPLSGRDWHRAACRGRTRGDSSRTLAQDRLEGPCCRRQWRDATCRRSPGVSRRCFGGCAPGAGSCRRFGVGPADGPDGGDWSDRGRRPRSTVAAGTVQDGRSEQPSRAALVGPAPVWSADSPRWGRSRRFHTTGAAVPRCRDRQSRSARSGDCSVAGDSASVRRTRRGHLPGGCTVDTHGLRVGICECGPGSDCRWGLDLFECSAEDLFHPALEVDATASEVDQ